MIEKLTSIIDPTGDYSLHDSQKSTISSHSAIQSSIVHIIGTGLTPTLMNLPLSTLLILSRSDVVLFDSLGLALDKIQQIVPSHCDLVWW